MNLKAIRVSRSISIYKLSKDSGVSQGYISEIESGKKSPTLRTLAKIADVLDVEISELIQQEREK